MYGSILLLYGLGNYGKGTYGMVLVKNPTQWRRPDGTGYIIREGTEYLTTDSGLFLVTELGDNLVTDETYAVPKYKTLWTASGV